MRRRRFLRQVAVALAGISLDGRAGASARSRSRRLSRIGLELYSVRDAMRRDPERTLAAVRAIGYTDVELLWSFGNFGRTTAQVKASLAREGLRAPSAHIGPELLLDNWARALETAKQLGHEYLIVPSLPSETMRSLDAWRAWAERFNRAGELARKEGLWLAFHNEPDHLKTLEGRIPYDLFVDRTEPSLVRLQLDVGNMTMGGGDPYASLERHRDRYWSFHLKDVVANDSHDTELGEGYLDFKRLLGMIPDLDAKRCYVEQEEAVDSLASARLNYGYLSRLEF